MTQKCLNDRIVMELLIDIERLVETVLDLIIVHIDLNNRLTERP